MRKLPDLAPQQVIQLQDALLANANRLLESAVLLLDSGQVSLARSLAILGLEESGKAIAIHDRRVAINHAPPGETFRCEALDLLWSSHTRKLEAVHDFLVWERYGFSAGVPDPEENASSLGTIKAWSRRQDRSKQRGFYVELSKTGEALAPSDITDEEALRNVIALVHQIGWQLRLGEHIEGKKQDQRERGMPALTDEDISWIGSQEAGSPAAGEIIAELKRRMLKGILGEPLPNPDYRFNVKGYPREPFGNMGKVGYEAETRELINLMEEGRGPGSGES